MHLAVMILGLREVVAAEKEDKGQERCHQNKTHTIEEPQVPPEVKLLLILDELIYPSGQVNKMTDILTAFPSDFTCDLSCEDIL
jgi:hypothetical protein